MCKMKYQKNSTVNQKNNFRYVDLAKSKMYSIAHVRCILLSNVYI